MRINKLALTNFRSYNSLELELQPGVITFIGDNGSGKTNIAESLIYLAFLSSHRVANNVPLISLGNQQAIVRAEVQREVVARSAQHAIGIGLAVTRLGSKRAIGRRDTCDPAGILEAQRARQQPRVLMALHDEQRVA